MAIEVSHKQLRSLLKRYRAKNQPIFIKGATGIGKSEAIVDDCKEYSGQVNRQFQPWLELTSDGKKTLLNPDELSKLHLFIDIRTALLEPTDLMGMPSLNGTYVEWKPTLLFRVLSMPEVSATLFFDEFNLGSRMVQNSCYQIILDKAIGEIKLGKDVFVIAAGKTKVFKVVTATAPAISIADAWA